MDNILKFQSVVREKNRRMTRQRRLVLRVLQESQDHLDAEAIHDRVRRENPSISLATVYRTLALLKELHLVSEHNLGEGHGHFEAAPDTPHYHFTCLGCHKVIEFQADELPERILPRLANQGIKIQEIHLSLSGYCPDCYPEPE